MAWLTGYTYRKLITITGSTAGAQTDYPMKLNVYKGIGEDSGNSVYLGGNLEGSAFEDVRFTQSDGSTELDHWRESWVADTSAIFWIEFDSIPASPDTTTFYIYYSKEEDSTGSNGANTFSFFDDFPGDAIDTDKWSTSGTIGVSGGIASLNEDDKICAKTGFGYGYCMEARSKADEQDSTFVSMWEAIDDETDKLEINNSDLYQADDFNNFNCQTRKDYAGGGVGEDSDEVEDWTDFRTDYCIYRIKRYAVDNLVFEQDANNYTDDNNDIPTITLYPLLRVWDSSQASTLSVDWVLVRKIVDPDPEWTSWGSQETSGWGGEYCGVSVSEFCGVTPSEIDGV